MDEVIIEKQEYLLFDKYKLNTNRNITRYEYISNVPLKVSKREPDMRVCKCGAHLITLAYIFDNNIFRSRTLLGRKCPCCGHNYFTLKTIALCEEAFTIVEYTDLEENIGKEVQVDMYEVKRGDIYFADLTGIEHHCGSEQTGWRPVMIVQNDVGNYYSTTTIIATITSKIKGSQPTHVYLESGILDKWKYYLDEAKQEESVQQELDKIKAEYATLKPEDIKLIDPCMGSGHILVYAFDVFMQIYENAGWSQRDAAQSIIQNNIYGLDIDDRAAQLSYFAVLMKARQYDRRILTRSIEPNVYAVQESNGINRGQLKYFGAGLTDVEKNAAVSQMEGLLNTLNDAKEYGSLLNVESYDWELLEKFVENTDTESQISFDTYGLDETAEQLKQLIKIGKVMAQKYEVVATNPPYAGTSNLSAKVNNFVKENYPDSKADLFAVFIERCGEMLKKNGYQAMITMHSWMFLSSFEKLRENVVQFSIENMAHLGARAFEEIGGEVVQTTTFVIKKTHIQNFKGIYIRLVEPNTQKSKEKMFLLKNNRYITNQAVFGQISGQPIAYWVSDNLLNAFKNSTLDKTANCCTGMQTGNNVMKLF